MTASAIAGTTSGLHHITGITDDVQANVDFYVNFLGLKHVKRPAGYADAEQLHLLYGDGLGSPRIPCLLSSYGKLPAAVVPASAWYRKWLRLCRRFSMGDWLTKALSANVPLEGSSREFGEPVLRLKDPDGLIVELVGVDMSRPAPLPGAPARLRGVTVLTDKAAETAVNSLLRS